MHPCESPIAYHCPYWVWWAHTKAAHPSRLCALEHRLAPSGPCVFAEHVIVSPGQCAFLRPWLPLLVRKMTEKDKKRVAKNKQDTTKAMVIKTVNKRGRVTVFIGCIHVLGRVNMDKTFETGFTCSNIFYMVVYWIHLLHMVFQVCQQTMWIVNISSLHLQRIDTLKWPDVYLQQTYSIRKIVCLTRYHYCCWYILYTNHISMPCCDLCYPAKYMILEFDSTSESKDRRTRHDSICCLYDKVC